jgi:iron complex outermembrane receptor protein
VPTGDDPATSINMKQRRFDVRGVADDLSSVFKSAKLRFGYGDYTHRELSGGETVNTTFKNKAWESRLELAQEKQGALSGILGLQVSRNDFSAKGDEVVTPATLTKSAALFALEEYKLDQVNLQFGGRYEWQNIALGDVAPGLPVFAGYGAQSGEKRTDHGVSLSAGAVYYPTKLYSLALSVATSQRLPVAQELYSNGPHGGTAAYEVGRSDLARETSTGIDLTLRRRGDRVTGSVGVFVNRFNGYIYEQRLPDSAKPDVNNPDDLPAYQFQARDALFYGGEAEVEIHLIDETKERLHLVLDTDYVHAEQTTDHEPLPRIPPMRVGGELRYERGGWTTGANLRYVFRQNRIAPLETETAGYALLGMDVGYVFSVGRMKYELFLRGANLADREARVHTSFLKDFAPLPGRNFTTGVRVDF